MSSFLLLVFAIHLRAEPILVAAASDLAIVEKDLLELAGGGGTEIRFTFGSSGQLASQIRNGAPYDVFLAANEKFVTDLQAAGKVIPDTVGPYTKGRIAFWSRSNSFSLGALGDPAVRHIAIANPAHAPYGAAAKQFLERQASWDKIQPKLVFAENVRQALQFAESGNAEVAIVSWAHVKRRGGILLDASFHDPLIQAGAVVTGTKNEARARKFLALLTGPGGQAVLNQFGFEPPIKAAAPPPPPEAKKRPKATRRSRGTATPPK